MNDISNLGAFIPFLIPLFLLQLVLLVWALIDIFKRDHYKVGNRVMWVLICLFVNTVGPILYFIIGRGEKRE